MLASLRLFTLSRRPPSALSSSPSYVAVACARCILQPGRHHSQVSRELHLEAIRAALPVCLAQLRPPLCASALCPLCFQELLCLFLAAEDNLECELSAKYFIASLVPVIPFWVP